MRFLCTLPLLAMLAAPAWGQNDRFDIAADKVVREGATVRGVGHARTRSGAVVLQADEMTLHHDSGKLEMRGHVHVTVPAREDHTVVRYGQATLLTDQPIGLTADQATLQNGKLEAAGGIVVVPVDEKLPKVQLRGDELSMNLNTSDATLRGNVRPSNIPEPLGRPVFYKIFPPDIVK